jgi:hypothetical protein
VPQQCRSAPQSNRPVPTCYIYTQHATRNTTCITQHVACDTQRATATTQRCNAQPTYTARVLTHSLTRRLKADAQTCTIHTACRPAPRLVHIRTCAYRRAHPQSTHEYRRARTYPLHVRPGTLRHTPAHSGGLGRAGRAGRAARCAVHSIAWLGLAGTVERAALGRTIARIIGSSSVIAPRLSVAANEPT